MKHKIILFSLFLSFAALFFSSCNRNKMEELARVEALMWTHPDSALFILETMDKGKLKGQELKYRYEILLAQANERNYLPATNDSSLRVAVKYFDEHREDLHFRMLGHYYLSSHLRDERKFGEQMTELLIAEEMAEQLKDVMMLRVIHDNKAYLLFMQNIPEKAYREYEKELEDVRILGDSAMVGYVFYRMGLCAEYFKEENAEELMTKGIEMLRRTRSHKDLCDALSALSQYKIWIGDYDEAMSLAKEAVNHIQSKRDFYVYNELGLVYGVKEKLDSAVWCYHQALECPRLSAQADAYSFLANIATVRKDYETANRYEKSCSEVRELLYWQSQQADVVNAEKEFVEKLDKQKHERIIRIFIVLALFLICTFALVWRIMKNRDKRSLKNLEKDQKELKKKLKNVHETIRNVGMLEKNVNDLKKEIAELQMERQNSIEKMVQQSDVMMKIERLAERDNDDVVLLERKKQRFQEHPKEMMKPEDWILLQEHIDKLYPGFCSTLVKKHKMKAQEVNLCCLLMTDLQPTGLSYVLGCSRSTFYDRQSKILSNRFGITDKSKRLRDVLISIANENCTCEK